MKNELKQNITSFSLGIAAPREFLALLCVLITAIILLSATALPAQETQQPATSQIGTPAVEPISPLNTPPSESASLFFAILKVLGSLLLVIGAMLLVVTLIKKLGLTGPTLRSGALINVLETKMLAPKKYVAVLEIAKQYMVIGITDQQINLIARLDSTDALANPHSSAGQAEGTFTESPFSVLIKKAILATSGKNKTTTQNEKP